MIQTFFKTKKICRNIGLVDFFRHTLVILSKMVATGYTTSSAGVGMPPSGLQKTQSLSLSRIGSYHGIAQRRDLQASGVMICLRLRNSLIKIRECSNRSSARVLDSREQRTSSFGGIQKDDGLKAMRYETQVTCSLTTSSVDIRSLKRRLLATPDAQCKIPTKKQKGCSPSARSSSSPSHSRAMRQYSPIATQEDELGELRSIVPSQTLATPENPTKTSDFGKGQLPSVDVFLNNFCTNLRGKIQNFIFLGTQHKGIQLNVIGEMIILLAH